MIRIETGDEYSAVRFHYDEGALKIIKSVPVHRWDRETKTWTTETSWVQLLAKRFHDAGYPVEIDGELWAPPDMQVLSPPIEALFAVLPVHLRKSTYLALSKVLHPDVGGDPELMKQLNNVMSGKKK